MTGTDHRKGGFTLLEALVSAALLSLLASAIVPLLRDLREMRGGEPRAEIVSIDELSQAADALLAQEESRTRLFSMLVSETLELDWPYAVKRAQQGRGDGSGSLRVFVKRESSGGKVDAAWWVFALRMNQEEHEKSPTEPCFVLRYGKIEVTEKTKNGKKEESR